MNIEENKASVKVSNQPGGKSNWSLYWNEPEKNPKNKTANSNSHLTQSTNTTTKASSPWETKPKKTKKKKRKQPGNSKKKRRKNKSTTNYPPMTPETQARAA